MCTIAILNHAHPAHPVIVAANRDEFYARPAQPPRVLSNSPLAIGGVDDHAGGSWMGATAGGLLVALTNQRTYHPGDRGLRSRGEVVLRALESRNSDGVARYLRNVDPRHYNPFNLLFGDANGLFVSYLRRDPSSLTIDEVPVGLSVLPNDRLDAPTFPKVARVKYLLSDASDMSWDALRSALQHALADHQLPPLDAVPVPPVDSIMPHTFAQSLQAVCVHTEAYSTRSSTIVALDPGRVAEYAFADGPPCRTRFESVRDLLNG